MEHKIPSGILDDLSSRFIINVPEEERKDLVRICFQIELAHWFYLDFYCTEEYPKLRSCGMKEFATHIFQHIPFLKPHVQHIDTVLEQWREYKQNVPTFGAIVLNEDMTRVLLVQSYWAKNSWGFPKGKVNEDEEPFLCAIREVLEETGFDISNLIDKTEYIESVINDQTVRLYIISGVQKDTKFQPKTRKEIKNVEWFAVADLPNTKKDMTPKMKIGVGPNAFFMVVPFVKRIKRWIQEKQQREKNAIATVRRQRHKSLGDVETVSKSSNKRQQQSLFHHFSTCPPQVGIIAFLTLLLFFCLCYNLNFHIHCHVLRLQSEVPDFKIGRQSNTSPARNRRGVNDNKKDAPKAAFKRNLFGDQEEDQSPIIKQLTDSPAQPYSFLIDPAIQSIKYNDFNYKAQPLEKEVKGTLCLLTI